VAAGRALINQGNELNDKLIVICVCHFTMRLDGHARREILLALCNVDLTLSSTYKPVKFIVGAES
jgi:hypothetical protein